MYTDDVRDKNFTAVKVNSQKQVQDVPEKTQPSTASRQYKVKIQAAINLKELHGRHKMSALQ
jgi:hypothetical protein